MFRLESQPSRGAGFGTAPPGPARDFPTKLASATVRVFHAGASGSGTVLPPDGDACPVVTCGHLFPQGARAAIKVRWTDGKERPAKLVSHQLDNQMDVAVLHISAAGVVDYAEVADTPTQPGDAVWQAGYPKEAGGRLNVRAGRYSQPRFGYVHEFSFVPQPGDSGGGIFRQKDQKFIAVVNTGISAPCGATGWSGVREVCQRPEVAGLFPRLFPRLFGVGKVNPAPVPPHVHPDPAPPKVSPLPVPVSPVPVVPYAGQERIAKLESQLSELRSEVADLRSRSAQPGPPGPPGPAGRDGLAGSPGPQGPPGPAADNTALMVKLDQLAVTINTLNARLSAVEAIGQYRTQVIPVK